MNPTKLALITKHGKKFVTKTKSVTDGVHYAADGSAIMTDRHRLLRIKDIHANTEPSTRCLTTGAPVDGHYPDTAKVFPKDIHAQMTITDADIPKLIAVTKAIVSVARSLKDRVPVVTIIDGQLTYNNDASITTFRSALTSDVVEHPPVAVDVVYLSDALAVFKDAGSAEISVFVSGQLSPIVLYDDKVGVDMIVLPVRTPEIMKLYESEAE